jgi:hypothetical protein
VAGSEIHMSSGTYRSTNSTNFGATLSVNPTDAATLDVDGTATFQNGSTTTLGSLAVAGTLNLNASNAVIAVGADFSGPGKLVNLPSSRLQISDGVVSSDVAVLVENNGLFRLGAPGAAAQAQLADLQQGTTGHFDVNIGGPGLNEFDRLTLTGAAQLAGALDLDLIGGFVPTVGQSFNILTATGGVTGMFTAVDQPSTMPAGLLFDVVYSPFIVQLQVVNAPIFSADFDVDGDVDGDDLAQWQGDFGVNGMSDADNDGDSDGADFLAWQQQLGSVPAVPAVGAVPEPASHILLAFAAITWLPFRMKSTSHWR